MAIIFKCRDWQNRSALTSTHSSLIIYGTNKYNQSNNKCGIKICLKCKRYVKHLFTVSWRLNLINYKLLLQIWRIRATGSLSNIPIKTLLFKYDVLRRLWKVIRIMTTRKREDFLTGFSRGTSCLSSSYNHDLFI
jgi:hypothetical protein